jgi:two-component sensor histidine kinase
MMAAETIVRRLAKAERGVALGSRHISKQRAIIDQLERQGHDPTRAKRLLATFEFSQRLFVESRNRLRKEITGSYGQNTIRTKLHELLDHSTDIDDPRAAPAKRSLAPSELQHRRNMLGVMRAIMRRAAETSENVEEFAMHLEGRFDSMARAQAAVAFAPLNGVALEALIAEEILAIGGRTDNQLVLSGPPLRLRLSAAEILALAIHELVTNAMKFGALSAAEGKLNVLWQIQQDAAPRLLLGWKESGLRGLNRLPTRRGFGIDLLERVLAYELDATTIWTIEPDGLLCTIEIPLGDWVLA